MPTYKEILDKIAGAAKKAAAKVKKLTATGATFSIVEPPLAMRADPPPAYEDPPTYEEATAAGRWRHWRDCANVAARERTIAISQNHVIDVRPTPVRRPARASWRPTTTYTKTRTPSPTLQDAHAVSHPSEGKRRASSPLPV
ncbi:hypothetical protein C8R47DRAFT_1071389 [Mycena vitilis]|nr:hypothetical protein C8R47DRAFT_1071389 [Mycena vitilis]